MSHYNLDFLNTVHRKIPDFSKKIFFFLTTVFFFKFFWKNFLKLHLYLILFKLYTIRFCHKIKKHVLIIFKKKKKSYILSIFLKKGLLITITIGSVLKYFKIVSKFQKKTKKGFLIFLNIFKKFFLKFKPKFFYKNVVINFYNFYLIFFWKKFKFLFEKRQNSKIFFNFNTNTTLTRVKKNKGIKKRLNKKYLNKFLLNWSSIKFDKNQEIRFKVK